MCKKLLLILTIISVFVFFIFISDVHADVTIPNRPIYFPFGNGAYLTFSTTILPLTFSGSPQNIYRDTSNTWHFGNVWITSTNNMIITAWFSNGWLNYTVTSSGTQQIYNGSKPSKIVLDNTSKSEGDGWSYSGGTVTITGSTVSASLYWGALTIVITASPSTANIQIGQTQNFTATTSGGLSPYTCQWYYSNNTSIGGNSTVLSIIPNTNNTWTYYCNVTDSISDIGTSNNVTLTVGLAPLNVTFANASSSMVGAGSTFYVNGTVLYNGTSIAPQSGLATIYAYASGNVRGSTSVSNSSTGNFNFSVTAPTSIGNWTYTIYAVNAAGASLENQTLYVVSNSLTISLNADTVSPSGGGTVNMNATATYTYDGANVTTLGVTITRNGTQYSQSTSWTDARGGGTVCIYAVQAANDTTYGLTSFTSNTLTISWGSTIVIEVSNIYQNTTHTGISQAVNMNYQVVYGGNLSNVNNGTLTINGVNETISNGWCNFTVSDPVVELDTYICSGSSFGGTVYSQIPSNPQVIFDEANVTLYFTSQSPQAGQNIIITWTATRLYDNSTIGNYNMTVNLNYAPVYMNVTQSTSSITDSLAGSGSKTYSVGSFLDSTYNMTAFACIPETVTWSQAVNNGNGGFVYTPQPSAYTFKVLVTNSTIPVVGVQIAINGQVNSTDVSGSASFSLAQGTYPITISENGQILFSSSVMITAQNQTIPIDLTPHPITTAPEAGLNAVSFGIVVITIIIVLSLIVSSLRTKKPEIDKLYKR